MTVKIEKVEAEEWATKAWQIKLNDVPIMLINTYVLKSSTLMAKINYLAMKPLVDLSELTIKDWRQLKLVFNQATEGHIFQIEIEQMGSCAERFALFFGFIPYVNNIMRKGF